MLRRLPATQYYPAVRVRFGLPSTCRGSRWCRTHATVNLQHSNNTAPLLSPDRLQRRSERLKCFLASLKWPEISHMTASGELYELPVRARSGGAQQPAVLHSHELQYLAGFFDGDGCVSPSSSLSSCTLCITQVFDRGEALLRFHKAFGGGIYCTSAGCGAAKPNLQWSVRGDAGKQAASRLLSWPSMKQAQLHIASEWPTCTQRRLFLATSLKSLKHFAYQPGVMACTWAYLAGFFDAEGHIQSDKDPARYQQLELLELLRSEHAPALPFVRELSLEDQLQRRCTRLIGFMRRLRLPKIKRFCAFGVVHDLPIKVARPGTRKQLSAAQLEYLVGFFDGDGCVSACMDLSGSRLTVGQSVGQPEAVMMFHKAFGGGVYNHSQGSGYRQPSLQWVVSGQAAAHAAHVLGKVQGVKTQQLRIAACWPACPNLRAEAALQLKNFKSAPEEHSSSCRIVVTWPYLAGFFDAEGSIHLRANSRGLRLSIWQKRKNVLSAISTFLTQEVPEYQGKVHKQGPYHNIDVFCRAQSQVVLRRLISAGLLIKLRSAEAALSLTQSDHAIIHSTLAELSGKQNCLIRLDEPGCRRARIIDRANSEFRRLIRSGKLEEAQEKRKHLDEMRAQHALRSVEARYAKIRSDARCMIQRGAVLQELKC
ncbi:unnamed protein product [Polarella glacialis]|uniref:LAGLIDADG endonuclease n=1 Tax=Polarella glacialis TaxID=89957 RepID=A0A813LQK4_POLGL|nr:unnamed protein product [Polarella glacialis]